MSEGEKGETSQSGRRKDKGLLRVREGSRSVKVKDVTKGKSVGTTVKGVDKV